MVYIEFALSDLPAKLGVRVVEERDLFPGLVGVPLSPPIQTRLEVYLPLAIAMGTEKGRSELLVAPLLADVWEHLEHRISWFSGWDFPVDRAKGLNGGCDFILCRSPQQEFIEHPLAIVVEAENDNIKPGLGQCGAAMLAAKLFNERAGLSGTSVVGCVTTGTTWRFLRLDESVLRIDKKEYYLAKESELIKGIFVSVLSEYPSRPAGRRKNEARGNRQLRSGSIPGASVRGSTHDRRRTPPTDRHGAPPAVDPPCGGRPERSGSRPGLDPCFAARPDR